MSKKSRKRNKKILAAIGIGLGAAALASKKRNASIQANEAKEAGFKKSTDNFEDQSYSTGPKKDTSKKIDYITKKEKPEVKIAKRSSRGAGDYPDYKSAPTRVNGVKIKGRQNAKPITPFDPAQGNKTKTTEDILRGSDTRGYAGSINYKKDGGRAGLKSGGKAIKKSMGKALRGGGKVMR